MRTFKVLLFDYKCAWVFTHVIKLSGDTDTH